MKHLGHKIHDKDLSSESGQSHEEAPAVSESSLNENTSTQSGNALSLTILSVILSSVNLLLHHWELQYGQIPHGNNKFC